MLKYAHADMKNSKYKDIRTKIKIYHIEHKMSCDSKLK